MRRNVNVTLKEKHGKHINILQGSRLEIIVSEEPTMHSTSQKTLQNIWRRSNQCVEKYHY